MIPGNLVWWNYFPVSNPIFSIFFIPSTSAIDLSITSASGRRDLTVDLFMLLCLSFTESRDYKSLELLLKVTLNLFLKRSVLVEMKLFLILQLKPDAATL